MADIVINLQTTRNAIATANNITVDLNRNQFFIVAGEENATIFEIRYDATYFAGYTFYVEMVNAKGYGIDKTAIVNDTFVLPEGMAVSGYAYISITAEKGIEDSPNFVKIVFMPVKLPVYNTIPTWREHISSGSQVYVNPNGYLILQDDDGTTHNIGYVGGASVYKTTSVLNESATSAPLNTVNASILRPSDIVIDTEGNFCKVLEINTANGTYTYQYYLNIKGEAGSGEDFTTENGITIGSVDIKPNSDDNSQIEVTKQGGGSYSFTFRNNTSGTVSDNGFLTIEPYSNLTYVKGRLIRIINYTASGDSYNIAVPAYTGVFMATSQTFSSGTSGSITLPSAGLYEVKAYIYNPTTYTTFIINWDGTNGAISPVDIDVQGEEIHYISVSTAGVLSLNAELLSGGAGGITSKILKYRKIGSQ